MYKILKAEKLADKIFLMDFFQNFIVLDSHLKI